jgi:malonyl-CoA/methylmalonyl-CoA synthetase
MQALLDQAHRYRENIAIVSSGKEYDYQSLLRESDRLALILLNGQRDLNERRVAFMVTPGFEYAATMWAIWRAGGIAVPLCLTYPLPSLCYTIEDSDAEILVLSPDYEELLAGYAATRRLRLLVPGIEGDAVKGELPVIAPDRRAMILYTSGTTSQPKGVVSTHENIQAQIESLISAWGWSPADAILNVLPLHHVHGIINVVSCALYSGARCFFMNAFEASSVFDYFLSGSLNVFMAVPTIYHKLIAHYATLTPEKQSELSLSMKKFRLMVSGSAALPVTVMQKWEEISGQKLLERYGMTEIGMAISNPYVGERRAGCVGLTLPGVEVQLVESQQVLATGPGEIWVRGRNVFKEYWRREAATKEAFSADGWFKTGDIAVIEEGYYKIMGRNSVDIIKSGGYKISALEIEEVLRTHPGIRDCAVVGVENEEWGEVVAAAIVASGSIDINTIDRWIRERLPAYRVPRQYSMVRELPRNAMGKVVKPEVKKLF